MSSFKLTPGQEAAVNARGSSVLVSAAAGSGKTRVLTERLMSYVCDKKAPQNINEFLIITYTRSAAAELRGRILEELSARIAADPENRRLRRQNTLCYRAQIGTIHSFCTGLLRENCIKLGLSPDFRVGDEDKCGELKDKALEKLLDAAYEHISPDSDFSALADSVGAGRDDSRLAQTVLELHSKMQSHAYPKAWAEEQILAQDVSHCGDCDETIWGAALMENAKSGVDYWSNRLDDLWFYLNSNEAENAPLIAAYGESLQETMDAIRDLRRRLSLGWDNAQQALPIPFPRLKALRNFEFEETKNLFTSTRDGCKKAMTALCAVFDAPSEKLLSELSKTTPAMSALLRLTMDFDSLYSAEKRRLNLLDFSDLEHFAVRLLCQPDSGKPTEVAREISKRFTEIMVDEYQDVSAVQELIFRCVSKDEANLFMVGDVKQSIYRFRLADPSIFLKKYKSFDTYPSDTPGKPVKILLQQNFRSDPNILAVCNHIFKNTMSESLGEILYDDSVALSVPDGASRRRGIAEISILATPQDEDAEERPDMQMLEAQMVARHIKQLVTAGETIFENGGERPLQYSDIAILLRSPGSVGKIYRQALCEAGVPSLAEQGGGFFREPETLLILSLLSVIDNPHNDIPLTAVLSSPIFGFTADELSQIRAEDKNDDFFTALESFSPKSEKCRRFLEILAELRSLSCDIGVHGLLAFVYDRLELPALFAAKASDGGATAKLMGLLELARSFEENGYRGLFRFLAHLKRMEERGEEPKQSVSAKAGAVSIMSIHKSKGLEFPVVFLANTSRRFNTSDLRAPVLIHPSLGLGAKITDSLRGIEYPNLARRAIAQRLSSEALSEEMRVLYVALTRAKERLYISATAKDPALLIGKLSENLSSPISPEILRNMPSPAHWLISAALLDSGGLLKINPVNLDEAPAEATFQTDFAPPSAPSEPADAALLAELDRAVHFRYPYEKSVALPSKLTATLLPSEEADEDAAPLLRERRRCFAMPDFSGEERPLTAPERGTATHLVMQFIDYSKTETEAQIKAEISRIVALGQLSERQARAVDSGSILRFFASETGQRIKNADSVLREFRFSLLCPAEEFYPEAREDELLLQGVVDCCIEENGQLTVIDFKTDSVSPETLNDVAERYKAQVKAYALALGRITKKPVRGSVLCFLRAGLSIPV
ncbi:MAG: UvrD-helicase domain-containing protein [Oscillospiraceae bacterium]